MHSLIDINAYDLGNAIRGKREELNISRATLSEQADISEYYLGEIERGEKMPSVKCLRTLCYCLHTSMDKLLGLPDISENDSNAE